MILVVLDGSQPLDELDDDVLSQITDNKRLVVLNKADLPPVGIRRDACACCAVSAKTGEGMGRLRREIANALDFDPLTDRPAITNVRHIALVARAHDALMRARAAALAEGGALSEEFVLADLQHARGALEEVTGRRAPEDVLEHIFSRFCIGK